MLVDGVLFIILGQTEMMVVSLTDGALFFKLLGWRATECQAGLPGTLSLKISYPKVVKWAARLNRIDWGPSFIYPALRVGSTVPN